LPHGTGDFKHGPKLIHFESPSALADSIAAVKNRPLGVYFDQQGDHRQHEDHDHTTYDAYDYIKYTGQHRLLFSCLGGSSVPSFSEAVPGSGGNKARAPAKPHDPQQL
jgi:hypothetical protein